MSRKLESDQIISIKIKNEDDSVTLYVFSANLHTIFGEQAISGSPEENIQRLEKAPHTSLIGLETMNAKGNLNGKYISSKGELYKEGMFDDGKRVGLWECPKDDDGDVWYLHDEDGELLLATHSREEIDEFMNKLEEQKTIISGLEKLGFEII